MVSAIFLHWFALIAASNAFHLSLMAKTPRHLRSLVDADEAWKIVKLGDPTVTVESNILCTEYGGACGGPYGHPVVTLVYDVPTDAENSDALVIDMALRSFNGTTCGTPAPTGVALLSGTNLTNPNLNRTAGTDTIKYVVDPTALTVGEIPGTQIFNFCVRSDLKSSAGIPMNYEEIAVQLTKDLEGTFTVTAQSVQEYAGPNQFNTTVTALIKLNAYHCNNDTTYTNSTAELRMGKVMYLCVDYDALTQFEFDDNATEKGLTTLELFQDNVANDVTRTLLATGVRDATYGSLLQTIFLLPSKQKMVIPMIIPSAFYAANPTNPNDIKITGSVDGINLKDRRLADNLQRKLDSTKSGAFTLEIPLTANDSEEKITNSGITGVAAVGAMAMISVSAMFAVVHRNRISHAEKVKDDNTNDGNRSLLKCLLFQ